MSRLVSVVDLGMGNLRSVARAFERVGARVQIVNQVDQVLGADFVVVPGQGAFRDGAQALSGELGQSLREVVARGVPYLGLCLGMQLLFDSSEEAPGARGLGVFPGSVVRIPGGHDADGTRLKVPHMGWNEVRSTHPCLPEHAYFYFVHSYHCVPKDPACVIGTTQHGIDIVAAVAHDNVIACQFHPEKSQDAGEYVLKHFVEQTWS